MIFEAGAPTRLRVLAWLLRRDSPSCSTRTCFSGRCCQVWASLSEVIAPLLDASLPANRLRHSSSRGFGASSSIPATLSESHIYNYSANVIVGLFSKFKCVSSPRKFQQLFDSGKNRLLCARVPPDRAEHRSADAVSALQGMKKSLRDIETRTLHRRGGSVGVVALVPAISQCGCRQRPVRCERLTRDTRPEEAADLTGRARSNAPRTLESTLLRPRSYVALKDQDSL